jgi:hypothetical protein
LKHCGENWTSSLLNKVSDTRCLEDGNICTPDNKKHIIIIIIIDEQCYGMDRLSLSKPSTLAEFPGIHSVEEQRLSIHGLLTALCLPLSVFTRTTPSYPIFQCP